MNSVVMGGKALASAKTMSIVGMCKNAGKTTVLNWILQNTGRERVLGLTSIGRDGESTDVVTGTEKPSIFVPEGTLLATAKDMLRLRDVDPEKIRAELKATGDDGIQVIARHMNYGLYRVEGKADCPRDALNICRMLSLKPEILAQIEQSY